MRGHGIVLHGHEQGVEDDADSDGQVHEGVHDDQIDDLLDLQPDGTTLPDEDHVGELIPPRWTTTLRFLQFWEKYLRDPQRKEYIKNQNNRKVPNSANPVPANLGPPKCHFGSA